MNSKIHTGSKEILYVDDEPQALKYFSMLYGKQFVIATANSADEALEYIEANHQRVGVLVTDQRMPGRTGVQLMEQVKTRYPNIVRILITAFSELDAAIQSVNEGGAFRYLTKPVNEREMIGTLLRALEHYNALSARDQLMREKLSVLHRLIVMDRVRGLATAATALDGRIRNAWHALVEYMQQSPVRQRIRVQMEEIAEMNMVAVARREGEFMVRTVELLLMDTIQSATGEENFSLLSFLKSYTQDALPDFQENDIEFSIHHSIQDRVMNIDRGMLKRLISIGVRRIADMLEQPTKIELRMNSTSSASSKEEYVSLELVGAFQEMTSGQVASLFSAAIPLHKWPIGLDMDILSAFMIAHHLGGTIKVLPSVPEGPGFRFELPVHPVEPKAMQLNPNWFDTVYDSLEEWENEIVSESLSAPSMI
ncbi:MAG: response regulator [Pirellula sp.]|nr:response regulator [Pirellula sp.]